MKRKKLEHRDLKIGKRIERRTIACHHEAGHVVASVVNGFRVSQVSISDRSEDISAGQVVYDDRDISFFLSSKWGPEAQLRAYDYGVGLMAGIVAHSRLTGESRSILRVTEGEGDFNLAKKLAGDLSKYDPYSCSVSTTRAYIDLWESKAYALVNHRRVWPSIVALATALQKVDCVAGEELVKLLHETVAPHLLQRCYGDSK